MSVATVAVPLSLFFFSVRPADTGPTIDVVGRTTFSYDPDRGNRIFSYDEVWEVEPAVALLQLFRPGGRKNDGNALLPD